MRQVNVKVIRNQVKYLSKLTGMKFEIDSYRPDRRRLYRLDEGVENGGISPISRYMTISEFSDMLSGMETLVARMQQR